MKLQENMYVRNTFGRIAKIEYIEDDTAFCDNWLWQSYEDHINFINLKDEEDVEDIIKVSFDVIDLIEVGDYVNGSEIYRINFDSLGLILETTDYSKFREKDIKSIVTHEQMEQMSYEIGE